MNSCVILLVLFVSVATFRSSATAQPTATVKPTRKLPTFRLFGTPVRTPSVTPSPSATPRPAPPHTDGTIPGCENRSLGTIPGRRRLLLDADTGNVSGITLTLPRLLSRVKAGILQKMVSYTHKHARLRSESSYNLDMLEPAYGDMIYQGGPIMTGCPINLYTIYYGYFSSSTIDVFDHFLSNLGDSSYWRITSKFYDYSTTVGPRLRSAITHATDYPYTTSITIYDIEGMIQRAIDHAVFPSDENGLYLVLTGPGIMIDYNGFGFCSHFCGFHKIYDYPIQSNGGQQLKISVVGYPDESCYYSCDVKENSPNFDRPADFMVRVAVHELAESVTDPFGVLGNIAWTDENYYEISDKCSYTYGDVYLSSSERGDFYHNVQIGDRYYLLQQLWRVSIQGCGLEETDEISEPTPTDLAPTPSDEPTPTD
eukprot:CAMPEP_0184654752 /NCGR_PEP_ID=MMETSP0308-20130426/12402_1 /TAXON_ID=38269 /ORGANISM="Gloeochaete witrockiana, Strain SAG 46.84" /LENGTH=425 /DNA_ID=CAMNT_0027090875 /DNA_START=312 /DNA_END=1589 /DNA_ORIENTATION=-